MDCPKCGDLAVCGVVGDEIRIRCLNLECKIRFTIAPAPAGT